MCGVRVVSYLCTDGLHNLSPYNPTCPGTWNAEGRVWHTGWGVQGGSSSERHSLSGLSSLNKVTG